MRHARWRDRARRAASSLWAVPLLAAVLAFAAARLLALADRSIPQTRRAWYLFGGQAESARDLLSTIASSLMTFTGIVFSVTILVLQQASSQYSPRVLPTFLEDRVTRASMGVFIGSFVYAMALLPEVRGPDSGAPEFVPALSVFVAFVSVLVSVAAFAKYIDRMAQSIRVIHIVGRIGEATRATIQTLFPSEPPATRKVPPGTLNPADAHVASNTRDAGVIASVDEERLVDLAVRFDAVVDVVPRIGDFVPRGAPLLRVWSKVPLEAGQLEEILDCVVIAGERTVHQDLSFGFRQLVDIAERALSPGVNDPTTAVQALDQIHDLLRTLAVKSFPPEVHADPSGRVRLTLAHPGWDVLVHLGLDEIRQYGQGSVQVSRRLRVLLNDLLTVAPPERRAALRRQLDLLDGAVERGFASVKERELARAMEVPDA